MEILKNKGLVELNNQELSMISGGSVIRKFGAWCHTTWCNVKDAIGDGLEAIGHVGTRISASTNSPIY